jgi:hypothetical protein
MYSSSALNKFNTDVETASSDFLDLINLDKSSEDMQFQTQTDNNTIASDRSTLELDTSQDNTDCNLSVDNPYISCDRSLENQAKSNLNTATSQLTTDQQTLKSQQSQQSTLGNTVLSDLTQATKDSQALGL